MKQFSIDALREFEMVVQQSQNTNAPVPFVAQQIVDIYTGGQSPDAISAHTVMASLRG